MLKELIRRGGLQVLLERRVTEVRLIGSTAASDFERPHPNRGGLNCRIAEIAEGVPRFQARGSAMEWFEERAGILQFEAGLSRFDAEREAAAMTWRRFAIGVAPHAGIHDEADEVPATSRCCEQP